MDDFKLQTDSAIRHQTYLARYSTGLAKELLLLFDDKKLLNLIKKGENVNKINKRIEKIIEDYRKEVSKKMNKDFREVTEIELDWMKSILNLSIGKGINIDETIDNALNYPLQYTNTTPKVMLENAYKRVIEQTQNVNLSLQNNIVTDNEAITLLKAAMVSFKNNLDIAVRTSTFAVASQAREEAYRANEDIIRGVIICAVLDGRTTNYCKSMDGTIFKLDEGPRPPFHPRCRTMQLQVFTDETDEQAKEKLKSRASVGPDQNYEKGDNKAKSTRKNNSLGVVKINESDKKLKSSSSYGYFLKSQVQSSVGKEFIRDSLGVARGNLFIKKIEKGEGENAQKLLKSIVEMELNSIDLDGLRRRKTK